MNNKQRNCIYNCLFVCYWRYSPQWVRASSFTKFLDRTQRRTTVGRTPLDKWSARHRDLYLTTYNTHNRQTSMPLVGFEPTISAGERPQTYALDRAATGTGLPWIMASINECSCALFCWWQLLISHKMVVIFIKMSNGERKSAVVSMKQ